MIISGIPIAEYIYSSLSSRVERLKQRGVMPHLVVLLIGDDPNSISYIKQKSKAAERIGARLTVLHLSMSISQSEIIQKIQFLNGDPKVHAILVQKPLPSHIDSQQIDLAIAPEKDIDGFNPKSSYTLALPLGVEEILRHIYIQTNQSFDEKSFFTWLQTQKIVILGKGETAGRPTIRHLQRLKITPTIIDSQTQHKSDLLKNADIIISAVGKRGVVQASDLHPGVILIGVGMHREEDGKLHGDYLEEDIKNIASFYTPTPGGVGPVNVACLMRNLIKTTEQQMK